MPDPAVYVVRRHGLLDVSRSYRGALTLDRDLFWGPDRFMAFVDQQTMVQRAGIDVFAAVVVDFDSRDLSWFTTGALSDIPTRRRYLDLLRQTWPGWTVQWAFGGTADLAELSDLTGFWAPEEYEADPVPADWWAAPPFASSTLVTVARGGSVEIYRSRAQVDDHLAAGPGVTLEANGGPATLALATLPAGGLHLDVEGRRGLAWTWEPTNSWLTCYVPGGATGASTWLTIGSRRSSPPSARR